MTQTSAIGAPPKTFSSTLLIGFVFTGIVVLLLIVNGTSIVADHPLMHDLASVCALVAAVAFVIGLKAGPRFESIIAIVFAPIMAWGMMDVSSTVRGDHEINESQYDWIASTLRQRPEGERLLVQARTDGIVSNDELAKFENDLSTLNRRKVLKD